MSCYSKSKHCVLLTRVSHHRGLRYCHRGETGTQSSQGGAHGYTHMHTRADTCKRHTHTHTRVQNNNIRRDGESIPVLMHTGTLSVRPAIASDSLFSVSALQDHCGSGWLFCFVSLPCSASQRQFLGLLV